MGFFFFFVHAQVLPKETGLKAPSGRLLAAAETYFLSGYPFPLLCTQAWHYCDKLCPTEHQVT